MDNQSPSMLKSTLIGGLAFGVAGGLPIVGAVNCACCALIIGAGFLAAYLYSNECKKVGVGFNAKSGAAVGLVAGLFYALAGTVVNLPFRPGPEEIDEKLGQMEGFGAPPEAIEIATRIAHTLASTSGILLMFFITLLLAAVFSTLGGVIGGAVFKVEAAQPPAPGLSAGPPGFTS